MRIGIDVRLWNESGVGRYIRNLVGQLHKLGQKNEYVLFCLEKDEQEILNQVQDDKFKVVRTNIRWHTIEEQIQFPKILNKETLYLVHFPYFSVPIFYKGSFVVTIHDLIINHFDTGEASTLPLGIYQLKRLGYKHVISHAINRAQKIITVSQATKKEIIDHYKVDPEKIVVTYEGIDKKISNFKFQISNKYQLPKGSYFLYVGNAYPHKNLVRLIDAFKQLLVQDFVHKVHKDLKLVLVGKEDYFYRKLKKYVISNGIDHSLIFYGYVTDRELAELYKNAKALVSPARMEGFDLPVIEAMSNNCLVMLSDIVVHREIVGDAAFYFDPKNVSSIGGVFMRVLKKDDRIESQKKKGLLLVKKFSWRDLTYKTLEVYESCHRLRSG